MTVAPVGLRCPDHAGNRRRVAAPRIVRRTSSRVTDAPITKALIAANVAIYLITAVQGNGLNNPNGSLFLKWALYGPAVAQGDWWRLLTAAFLHLSVIHIGLNMLALWWIGRGVEQYLGSARYVLLYLVSGLAGSAGALLLSPNAVTVGASGAIFGVLGSMLIIEWQLTGKLGGQAASLIMLNLVINFAINGTGGNISIGGHLGGLVGGILVTLAFANWGRGHAAYGKVGVVGAAGVAAVAVASVLVAYLRVRGMG